MRILSRLLFASALSWLAPLTASSQAIWSELPPGTRAQYAAAFDAASGDWVVVMGYPPTGLGTRVLRFDLNGTPRWFDVATTGGSPPARYGASLVYDPTGHRMILFGGSMAYGPGDVLNDVWALDAQTNVWTQITPAGAAPPGRLWHSAVYDAAHQRMVIFGGETAAGDAIDTWTLSLSGSPAWSPLATTGSPPVNASPHSAIYDGGTSTPRMLVCAQGPSFTMDTWQLTLPASGTPTWTVLATTGGPPPGRGSHSTVLDALNRRILIFGGSGGGYLNDVWALSLATSSWSQIVAPPVSGIGLPKGRVDHDAVYDPFQQRMLIYGGTSPSMLGDTWALSLSGTPRWQALMPTARRGPACVLDAPRSRMLLFGGLDPGNAPLGDLWAYEFSSPARWVQIVPSGVSPTARGYSSFIHDRVNDRFILFGGYAPTPSNDVWALSPGPLASWTQLAPTGTPPSARAGHTAVYDQAGARMLVFGGDVGGDGHVWALQLAGSPAWSSPGLPGPLPRSHHTAVFDPVYWGNPSTGHMIVFGGIDGGSWFHDTWDWIASSATWMSLPASGPGDRYGATAVYDSKHDRMLLFGGIAPITWDYGAYPLNDVWRLPFDGTNTWSQQFAAGTAPDPRGSAGGVYDPAGDRLLVFGGFSGTGPPYYDDLWELRLALAPTAVPDAPPSADFRLGPVAPNPVRSAMSMTIELGRAGTVEVAIFDVMGRQAHFDSHSVSAGRHELTWDGVIEGKRARPGVYLARVRAGGEEQARRFVLLP